MRECCRIKPRKVLSPLEKNCKTLYETIRDYREPKANRQLSLIFMKLPSKNVSTSLTLQ